MRKFRRSQPQGPTIHPKGSPDQMEMISHCKEPKTSCPGLMLLRPQKHVFWGMLRYAESLKSVEGGDQELIQRYFNEVLQPCSLQALSTKKV
eukprot:5203149-Amphidinium_carterae.1